MTSQLGLAVGLLSSTILITMFYGKWEGWEPINQLNHSSWMSVVTPTNHPKPVRNCYVIEVC